MTFLEAAKELKIKTYPEELDSIWNSLEKGEIQSPLTKNLILHLEERFGFFGKFFEDLLRGFDELTEDTAIFVWTHTVSFFAKKYGRDEVKDLILPEPDGSLAMNLAPYFILLVRAEESFEEYLRRGFSEEEVRAYFTVYQRGLANLYKKTGKPGLGRSYFNWVNLYTYTEIFHAGGFQFQFGRVSKAPRVLKNKLTKKAKVLLTDVSFHKDGQCLGSAGFCDEEGSFVPYFEENENSYKGYAVNGLRCENKAEEFSKNEWDLALQTGDGILCLHIPRGTDISEERVYNAYRIAKEIALERFPERQVKGLHCTSWLLSAEIEELLGENSAISKFSRLFDRYPVKSDGNGIFGFVFSSKPADLNDLPEETSLQRKLKSHYLSGSFALNYGGFLQEK